MMAPHPLLEFSGEATLASFLAPTWAWSALMHVLPGAR